MKRILLFLSLILGFTLSTVTAGTASSYTPAKVQSSQKLTKRQQKLMKKMDKLSRKVSKNLGKSDAAAEAELRKIIIIGFAGIVIGIVGNFVPVFGWLISLIGSLVVLYALYLFIMYLLDNVDL